MNTNVKPLLRGHFHQAAFFLALGGGAMLLPQGRTPREIYSLTVYALSLLFLFAVSALYHRITWSTNARRWWRRLDHAAIFVVIAGSGTPLSVVALPEHLGARLLWILWSVAIFGILQSLFWVHAPKWVSAVLYVLAGWVVLPYLPEFNRSLDSMQIILLVSAGVVYTIGALVYGLKRPNPWPKIFGYHEIFHLLVVFGAVIHFVMIARLFI